MAYLLENGIWSNIFAVPCEIVDRHIKLCSPLSLKVLMVLLRYNGGLDVDQLAEVLGQSRADVQDALNYWIANGVLNGHGQEIDGVENGPPRGETRGVKMIPPCGTMGDMEARSAERSQTPSVYNEAPAAKALTPSLSYAVTGEVAGEPTETENGTRRLVSLSRSRPRLTTQEINEMAEIDSSIGYLLQETQQVMGKPLTPVATDMVAALYSYYGMKPDLILMLIQYCVSIGKDSVRYMEKVAASWLEQGIDSHERAEAEILRATQQNQVENRVKRAFGIYDRTLIAKEKNFIKTWTEEYNIQMPLIELAFERCVEIKGKVSFDYINGILTNWHQKKVTTATAAMHEINRGKQKKPGSKGSAGASYDMDQLENMISHGDLVK